MREILVDTSFYERRPGRVAVDLICAWGLIVLGLGLAVTYPQPLVWIAAGVVIGTQQYALQILLHDGLHRTLLSSKTATDRLCRLFLSYPLFTALEPFRWKHLEHHRSLGTPADPDRYYYTARDKATRWQFLRFCTGLSAAWAAFRALMPRREAQPGGAAVKSSAPARAGLDWLAVLLTQAAIAVSLTWLGGPLAYPLLWLVPFGVLVFVAQSLRSFSEHAHPVPDGDAGLRLVTYRSNWLERVFLAPHNMNFHAEHHLYPQVPYYHLPRLRERLREAGELSEVEFRGSYLGFMLRYLRSLPHPPVAATAPPVASSS